jgi:hypothetical protein
MILPPDTDESKEYELEHTNLPGTIENGTPAQNTIDTSNDSIRYRDNLAHFKATGQLKDVTPEFMHWMSKLETLQIMKAMEVTLDPIDGKWERIEHSCHPRLKTISPGNSFPQGNISNALRKSTRQRPMRVGASGQKEKEDKGKIFLYVRPI